jgi:DNA-binding CsgD family transcriptional regulator
MPPTSTTEISAAGDVPISLPLDTHLEHSKVGDRMALLALSHTPVEHRLYEVMHGETINVQRNSGSFSVRRLLGLSGLRSYGSVKRGCEGLVRKRSIESIGRDPSQGALQYQVFGPDEIFARRLAAGMRPYPEEICSYEGNHAFGQLIHHVVGRGDLTRREALVTLCCAEGLSNAEIGTRLKIGEQTVKSHLRVIFDKFGVKRRAELVSRLLTTRNPRMKRNGKSRAARC